MINLSPKDTERYHELFKKLDTNSDGTIDVNDLVALFDKIKDKKYSKEFENDIDLIRESSLSRAKVFDLLLDFNFD